MKTFLKKFISPSVIFKIKQFLSSLDEAIIPLFAWNRFLSSLYYLVFSREFYREHQAVLQGRINYKKSLYSIGQSSVLLRRNTHRLEKGLIMQPRREEFALAYIDETVECYLNCVKAKSLCNEELRWATNVLAEYFDIVKSSKKIDRLKVLFKEHAEQTLFCESLSYIPYQESERPELSLGVEQLTQLYLRRRSVRWYRDELVPIENVHQAIKMASYAPSACNRQPYEFYFLTSSDAVEIAKLAMGTAGFAENITHLMVIVGDLSAYPSERDKHVIYIDASLATMQLMLAFEAMGVSSCPINWPDIEHREKLMSKKLGLAAHQRPVMLLAFGYAESNGKIPFSQKKSSAQLLKEVKL